MAQDNPIPRGAAICIFNVADRGGPGQSESLPEAQPQNPGILDLNQNMTEQIKPIALFDMDGTIADYVSAMKRDMESLRSPEEPEIDEVNLWDETIEHIKARKETIE
ncbi:MAG: hypothetical protein MK554_13305, partial [Planctomycetes bacterium]|nr:hypothetical protein [Planctomycetota bacterium]